MPEFAVMSEGHLVKAAVALRDGIYICLSPVACFAGWDAAPHLGRFCQYQPAFLGSPLALPTGGQRQIAAISLPCASHLTLGL
jgi:hypothetical protein